jgi:hypothetical protein
VLHCEQPTTVDAVHRILHTRACRRHLSPCLFLLLSIRHRKPPPQSSGTFRRLAHDLRGLRIVCPLGRRESASSPLGIVVFLQLRKSRDTPKAHLGLQCEPVSLGHNDVLDSFLRPDAQPTEPPRSGPPVQISIRHVACRSNPRNMGIRLCSISRTPSAIFHGLFFLTAVALVEAGYLAAPGTPH